MLCQGLRKIKPYIATVSLQFGFAGLYIIAMVSFRHGMSHYILSMCRHLIATLVISPFALILERPVLDQNLHYAGMKYTSATFASATVNVLPAITFIMAIIFSVAKVICTIITVTGGMVMTLFKGPIIDFIKSCGSSRHGTRTSVVWAKSKDLKISSWQIEDEKSTSIEKPITDKSDSVVHFDDVSGHGSKGTS